MVWPFKKKIQQQMSLYQKIINNPQSSQKIGVTYPPIAMGIEFKSLEEVLEPQKELLINIDQNTETADVFEKRYWPAIERFAKIVNLIPASENDHHHGPGGMLRHGLEVGLGTMNFAKASLYGSDMGMQKKHARERWLYACFIAGVCHDLGRIEIDVKVTAETGEVWAPHAMTLDAWATNNQIKKYYVDWRSNRKKEHEQHALGLLNQVLTEDDRTYLNELDSAVLRELTQALTGYSGESGAQDWPQNLRQMLKKADSISVREDLKRSRTPADLGLDRGTPLIRHYHNGIQRMFKEGRWRINEPGAAAWVLGPDQKLYLVWDLCGRELYDLLVADGVKGSPSDPMDIADVMERHELIDPAPDGSLYWRIKPDSMTEVSAMPLKAVMINSVFVPNLVEILPPGVSGSTRAEGEMLWASVQNPAAQTEKPSDSIIQNNPGSAPGYPPKIVQSSPSAPPPKVLSQPIPIPGPVCAGQAGGNNEVEKQTQPPETKGGLRSVKLILAGVGIGFLITIIYFLHIATIVDPDISFRTAFWMMAGNAFDNGYFFMLIVITGLTYIGLLIFPLAMRDVKEAKQQAAEIMGMAEQEAQGTKELAEKEAQEIKTKAEQEGQETRSLSEKEAQEIRGNAEKEAQKIKVVAEKEAQEVMTRAQDIKEQAEQKGKELVEKAEVDLLQAQAEASEILERAGDEARTMLLKEKAQCQDLWSWCNEKAKIAGVTPEEWKVVKRIRQEAREVLEGARREAARILSQDRGQGEAPQQHQVVEEEAQGDLSSGISGASEISQAQMDSENDKEQEVFADDLKVLENKIMEALLAQQEMKKRELERKVNKYRYDVLWELAIANLTSSGRIVFDSERKEYRCQHELFQ